MIPLTEDVTWIHESFALPDGRREHVSVYLLRPAEKSVLIDSGSFHDRDSLRRRIHQATGGRGIDSMILSHSDFPHSGNIPAFRDEWGDFEIVASCNDPAIQGLPYARRSRIGGTLDVQGRTFAFLDPPLGDRSHTSWIYDTESRVMFTADGFGHYHRPGEESWTSRDFPDGIRHEDIRAFHEDTVVWLRYVDPHRLADTLRDLFVRYPVTWVAPIHGNPIHAADLGDYLDGLERAVREIATGYSVTG